MTGATLSNPTLLDILEIKKLPLYPFLLAHDEVYEHAMKIQKDGDGRPVKQAMVELVGE
jgi:hypothetical protein